VLLNILALVAMLGLAYMSAAQGVYRAVQILVACVLAGTVAFGLCGPLASLGPSADTDSIWFYAADGFWLWAVFCVVLLGLRSAAEKMLPNQPDLPWYIDFPAGGALGLATGYLTVGVCLFLAQMMPVAPDFLGYEPFRFVPATGEAQYDDVKKGDPLWLSYDRGAVAFFGYVSSAPLGSSQASFFDRYGDLYPPPQVRPARYEGAVNVDDVLYYHWYRRYEAIRWRGYHVLGPVPRRAKAGGEGVGLIIEPDRVLTMQDVELRVLRVERKDVIEGFSFPRPPADHEFLMATLAFRAVAKWPLKVDSAQFVLLMSAGEKIQGPPLIYGPTVPGKDAPEMFLPPCAPRMDANKDLRGVRFAPGQNRMPGHYLADGATFDFADKRERDVRTFIFTVPKNVRTDLVRILLEPPAPTAPATPGPAKPEGAAPAKPAAPKTKPATK
jgi:hypothetical protein